VLVTTTRAWPRPQAADTSRGVCPALGAGGKPARLAAALEWAGLQPREPWVCRPISLGCADLRSRFCSPKRLASRTVGWVQTRSPRFVPTPLGFKDSHGWIDRLCREEKYKQNITTIIIIIVIVNNFFKKNYYCRNFGQTSLILLLIW
jgi:hypothetical protein